MAMIENDDKWLEQVQQDLVHSTGTLDDATRMRLAAARLEALEQRRPRAFAAWITPIAAVVTAGLVLAAVLALRQPQPPREDMLDDLDLITTSESLELFENLEFYEWLEAYDLPG